MPWSKKQQRTAQAVAHGWKPKGKAKDFDVEFAEQVLEESGKKGNQQQTQRNYRRKAART